MSILSDTDIRFLLGHSKKTGRASHDAYGVDKLAIEPLEDPDLQIQPASVDLRIGPKVTRFKADDFSPVFADVGYPPERLEMEDRSRAGYGHITIRPGEFMLGHTIECVTLGTNITGRVEGRSSIGRLGLLVHATAGYIDPGFSGEITLEMKNLSRVNIRIPIGMRVCQIVLETMSSAAALPYGSKGRGSRYQGQRGATPYIKAPE